MGVLLFYRSHVADALFLLVFHRNRKPGDTGRRAHKTVTKST